MQLLSGKFNSENHATHNVHWKGRKLRWIALSDTKRQSIALHTTVSFLRIIFMVFLRLRNYTQQQPSLCAYGKWETRIWKLLSLQWINHFKCKVCGTIMHCTQSNKYYNFCASLISKWKFYRNFVIENSLFW